MRAAAILGLGSSIRDLKPFKVDRCITWTLGLPAPDVADVVLIFGGDGTVHRHLAPLVKLGLPLLVVPQGSGNDFARALGIRRVADALHAWKGFLDKKATLKSIDLGIISSPDGPHATSNWSNTTESATNYYFCCVAGVGLDGVVTSLANRLPRWLRGHGGYALSLPLGLAKFRARELNVLQPSKTHPGTFIRRYSQPVLLAAFANTPAFGGGMRIAPRASLTDGLLDVCLVESLPKLKLLSLFPTVYLGRHLGIKQVQYFQAQTIRIETPIPTDVYADGEYVCRTPIEITVVPHALRVVTAQPLL